jgi:hypothetical protein
MKLGDVSDHITAIDPELADNGKHSEIPRYDAAISAPDPAPPLPTARLRMDRSNRYRRRWKAHPPLPVENAPL